MSWRGLENVFVFDMHGDLCFKKPKWLQANFSLLLDVFLSVQLILPLYKEEMEADPQELRADLQLKSRPASPWFLAPVIPKVVCS